VAKNKVRYSCVQPILPVRKRSGCNHVICTVTVHISSTSHSKSTRITGYSAVDPEAGAPRREGGQIYVCPAAGLAENYNRCTGVTP
jgi:hypothetical protein